MRKQHIHLEHLKKFAGFLLKNCLEDVVSEGSKGSRSAQLPVLESFGGSEEGDLPASEKNIKGLLFALSGDTPFEQASQALQLSKEDGTLEILRRKLDPSELLEEHKKQKQVLLSFISQYTSDMNEAMAVSRDLDEFHAYLEAESLKLFLETQQRKQSQLYGALEIAQIGSYTWDLLKDVIEFNPRFLEILGLRRDKKLTLAEYAALLHPADKQMFENEVAEAISHKWPLDVEYRIIRKNKEERILWGKGQVTYGENGEALWMQGTVLDVTEKRLTEIEVQYREAQLVEAQAIAGIGSFDWDFLNNKSTCTAELYRIFGWPAERELNFKTFEELSHPDDIQKVFLSLHNAMENKEPYDCEYRIVRPDGSEKWVWARGKVTFDENGNGIRLTGTVLDITERKLAEKEISKKNEAIIATYKELQKAQAELEEVNQQLEQRVEARTHDLEQSMQEQKKATEELRLKNEQLEKINTDLDNFIYTASHDLKAPILNIEGLVKLLSDGNNATGSASGQILEFMNASIQRFKLTIRDLAEIAKVQKEAVEDIELVSLDEVLDNALYDIQGLIKESGATIYTSFEVPELRFSRKNLRSVFYNLVSNSIKYRKEEQAPELNISSRREGAFVILTFADNGLGIPAGKVDKVFSMFKRLHSHVEGTGIGLYIVKRIIDNAGGRIEVESKEGEGSTFRLYVKAEN